MKIKNATIEVNGIENIVIDREYLWKKVHGTDPWWLLPGGGNHRQHGKSSEAMSEYVNALIANPGRRAWVHGDTLNIVKRPPPKVRDPTLREIEKEKRGRAMAAMQAFGRALKQGVVGCIAVVRKVKDAGKD